MRRIYAEETLLSLIALAMAGVAPNLFWIAQAGFAPLSSLAVWVLIPSIVVLGVVLAVARGRGHRRLTGRLLAGAAAGAVATVGLEVVRSASFHLGGMPGSMPELLGVLLTDRFMLGPSLLSNVAGWSYHFWNGTCFGIIFAVLFGRPSVLWAVIYGQLIGLGFLLSPAVTALGIGFMGLGMPAMPITVALAHLVFALILGPLCRRWVKGSGWLLSAESMPCAACACA
jgi:hypothetical protein